ncbi:uncharacterized protein LOC111696330 isoform X3 [Eurytemora carolleeae]|uniref:uncharacterized protein LOC111696330 isoform X3 n=1 Tax=Eurytemora carolleeae TaxID=1294199 RepID=UPI000C772C74|nr:uncharacterized protein LOC111696330 isoform X3 [Eurytemora carolleeae]|eukprot:XP_023321675.1 uncharacterized protein LOC111696330 isoform X3 [Eurytemora affinis]
MDSFTRWSNNQYTVEELCLYLHERDICSLCCVSKGWRKALNLNPVWLRIVISRGFRNSPLVSRVPESPEPGFESLEPSCYWARVLQYTVKLRYRWRNGTGVKTSLSIPECIKSSRIACFDADPDFLALGTESGCLLVYNTKTKQLQYINTVKQTKIEKLYVRHSKIVAVQFGLIQVYNISSELSLIFCKTMESNSIRSAYGVDHSLPIDPFNVPKLTLQQMQSRHGSYEDVDISKLDLTVSTVGEQRLGLVKSGETSFYIYSMESGEYQSKVGFEEDEQILKIGLVHVQGFESLLYAVVEDLDHNISGIMYDVEKKYRIWKIYLHTVFNYQFSVFSIFTQRGLLLFGRNHSDSYPYTWTWRSWSYQGISEYNYEFETEYDMYLADCLKDTVVTPRAMTYLYPGNSTLVFSHRTHRGIVTLAYSWPADSQKLWRISSKSEMSTFRSDTNVPLCGSDIAGLVFIGQGSSRLEFRDLKTGKMVKQIELDGTFTNVWSDDWRIVAINKDLRSDHPITIISFE